LRKKINPMDLIDLARDERQARLSAAIVTVILAVAILLAVIGQGASVRASSSHVFRGHDGTKPAARLRLPVGCQNCVHDLQFPG
jgi:hypothetical protein